MKLMNRIILLLIFSLFFFCGCKINKPVAGINSSASQKPETSATESNHDADFSEQSTWLLGYFNSYKTFYF